MGRSSKWIESQPDDQVEDVARRALASRLERTWYYLEQSVSAPPSETENVHQLRVSTRRTAAAMEIFADWLPRRRGRFVNKQVRKVRKAAGQARDLDVLRLRWTECLATLPSPQSALLLEQAKRRRRKAQWPIEDAYHTLSAKRFERRARKFVKRVRLRSEDPAACEGRFACLARVALGRIVVPYLQAAAAEMSDPAAMHAFRLQSKQVRYAMEIFAGAFDDDFRQELYPIVATLQDRLGEINDHVTAQTYLTTWRDESDAFAVLQAIEAGWQYEAHALEASRTAFLEWWSDERRQELRRHFSRYVELDLPTASPSEECA